MIGAVPRHIVHGPDEPVLAWGGPEHGRTYVVTTNDYAIFAVPPLSRRPVEVDPNDTTSYMLGTVRYSVQKFGWRRPDGDTEQWRVLVYEENFEGHKRRLEVEANFVVALATGAAWWPQEARASGEQGGQS